MLLDPDRFNFPNQDLRRAAVRDAVNTACFENRFTYTEALSLPEPLRSDVLEILDGAVVENNIPRYQQNDVQAWGGESLVLVAVKPIGSYQETLPPPDNRTVTREVGHIRCHVFEDQRIPGTNRVKRVKVPKDFGNAAKVPDAHPARIARQILTRDGWPIVQNRTNGGRIGTVVEWRWLEHEVKSGAATQELQALYNEIRQRESFKKLGLAEESIEAPQKQNQKGGQARLGA